MGAKDECGKDCIGEKNVEHKMRVCQLGLFFVCLPINTSNKAFGMVGMCERIGLCCTA